MGGCGKSSLAKQVAKEAEQLFDRLVFIVVSSNLDVQKIQEKIARLLDWELEEEHELERAIRKCLEKSPILDKLLQNNPPAFLPIKIWDLLQDTQTSLTPHQSIPFSTPEPEHLTIETAPVSTPETEHITETEPIVAPPETELRVYRRRKPTEQVEETEKNQHFQSQESNPTASDDHTVSKIEGTAIEESTLRTIIKPVQVQATLKIDQNVHGINFRKGEESQRQEFGTSSNPENAAKEILKESVHEKVPISERNSVATSLRGKVSNSRTATNLDVNLNAPLSNKFRIPNPRLEYLGAENLPATALDGLEEIPNAPL
ncbi:hypothetical protein L6164_013528 [Bauhinia variegata]|uniref:Uncharacterized protein n=1 Tax=Bauhinia variegata TaxID=167791 RepID=A0ACB9NGH4_BAUVA|nr:hypothetical protein L6164_013528 [Bauhinia variegata]